MKIHASRNDLYSAINKVRSVITKKAVIPILSHVLIETKKDGERGECLTMASSDLRVNIECAVPCQIDQEGSLTVSADRFFSVMSSFPEGDVSICLGENRVVEIQCGKIKVKLFSMSPDDFPPMRTFEGIEPIVLPQKDLREIFRKTSFAICTDQTRYNLTGLLFEFDGDELTCVSTDGRRLSLCKYRSEDIDVGISRKVTVPGKVISEVERLLKDEGEVSIYLDENQVCFVIDSVRLSSALIDGAFPNYEMVIPKKHDKEIIIDRVLFTDAVSRARVMTSDKFNSVRFLIADGSMLLRVITPDVGEFEEEIPVIYDGDKIEIAFNPDFILEVLHSMDASRLAFILKDAHSPGLLKQVADEGKASGAIQILDNEIHVIMPIRL